MTTVTRRLQQLICKQITTQEVRRRSFAMRMALGLGLGLGSGRDARRKPRRAKRDDRESRREDVDELAEGYDSTVRDGQRRAALIDTIVMTASGERIREIVGNKVNPQ